MAGYLIGEEGPLAGLIVRFEEGTEWAMGRDPDVVGIVLEDPMVSRKHVVCRLTAEGYILENLSAVNPATQNGMIISEPVLLREGDIIQIGNTFFRFSEKLPKVEVLPPSLMEETADLSSLSVSSSPEAKWMIKSQLREGKKGPDLDNLGVLLHGYSALQKVLNKLANSK